MWRVSNKPCTLCLYRVHIDMFEVVLLFSLSSARIPQEKPQTKPLPMHVVPLRMYVRMYVCILYYIILSSLA